MVKTIDKKTENLPRLFKIGLTGLLFGGVLLLSSGVSLLNQHYSPIKNSKTAENAVKYGLIGGLALTILSIPPYRIGSLERKHPRFYKKN